MAHLGDEGREVCQPQGPGLTDRVGLAPAADHGGPASTGALCPVPPSSLGLGRVGPPPRAERRAGLSESGGPAGGERRSCEEAVHEPARLGRLAIEAFAEEPEAAAGFVLDDVVVARCLRLLPAPPSGAMRSGPAHGRRGACVRASGSGAAALPAPRRRLPPARPQAGAARTRRRFLVRRRVRLALDVAARNDGAFRDVACDRPGAGKTVAPKRCDRASISETARSLAASPSEPESVSCRGFRAHRDGIEADRLEAEAGSIVPARRSNLRSKRRSM